VSQKRENEERIRELRETHTWKRNASNTPSNTHFSTHSLLLVKIHMGPTKSCGSHMNFNQSKRVCWKVCVRRCVASIPLLGMNRELFSFILILKEN